MDKGAALSIAAVVLRAVELLAKLGLVVLGNVEALLQLVAAVGKSALVAVLTVSTLFPVAAHFCLAHCLELLALPRVLQRHQVSSLFEEQGLCRFRVVIEVVVWLLISG